MKIQLVSDLHLEFGQIEINNAGADVLVLAGDIAVMEHWTVLDRAFFEHVSQEFKHVIYILGNHEHYRGNFLHTFTIAKNLLESFGNITVLDIGTVVIDDVVFVGGTLWTDVSRNNPVMKNMIRRVMNDYNSIRNGINENTGNQRYFSPDDGIEYHKKMLAYIDQVYQQEVNGQNRPIVIVGHHAPCHLSVSEDYFGDTSNCAYVSDLSDFILDRPQIKLWVHGHMHSSSDYKIGETRVVCNPRGYHGYGTNSTFNPNLLLEV